MQAEELKVGDIFRVDEPGYSNEPLECVDIQEYHVVYQPLNTSKIFNMSKGNKVVILEKEEEKILILKYITHNATTLTK